MVRLSCLIILYSTIAHRWLLYYITKKYNIFVTYCLFCQIWGSHDDVDDVVVRRVEDVWSNCTLKKVNLEFGVGLQLFITDYVLL